MVVVYLRYVELEQLCIIHEFVYTKFKVYLYAQIRYFYKILFYNVFNN